MDFELAARARQDLDRMWEYGSGRFGTTVADRMIDKFIDRYRLLASQPRMGREVPGVRRRTRKHV